MSSFATANFSLDYIFPAPAIFATFACILMFLKVFNVCSINGHNAAYVSLFAVSTTMPKIKGAHILLMREVLIDGN